MGTTRQKILLLILAVFIVLSLGRTFFLLWGTSLADFDALMTGMHRILDHKNPYLNSFFTQLNYLPVFLFLISPLSAFGNKIASNIWLLLSVLFFFSSIFILYKIRKIPIVILFLFVFLSVISFPFKFTLGMGQTNFILLVLICLFTYKIIKGKDLFAGIFLSLSIIVKLIPLLFVPYLFTSRSVKTLIFSFLSFLVFLLIPFFLLGKDINIYYFNQVFLPLIKESAGRIYYNQSITGFFSRLSLDASLLNITRIVIVCLSLWIIIKKKMGYFSAFSFLTVVILLVNNFTWQHHLVLLLIPYYFALINIHKKPMLILLFLSYLLVAFNIKNPETYTTTWYGNTLLSHGFFGMLILWFIFTWGLKKSEVG